MMRTYPSFPLLLPAFAALLVAACEPEPAAPSRDAILREVVAREAARPPRPRPACIDHKDWALDAGTLDAGTLDAGTTGAPMQGSDPLLRPPVPQAEAVIANLRPHFRHCYNAELAKHPGEEGCAVITVQISPDGSVTSAEAEAVDGLASEVTSCIASVLRKSYFAAPGGNGSMIRVPVKFVFGGPFPVSKPAPSTAPSQ